MSTTKSRKLVEKQNIDGSFSSIKNTQDKNVPYFDLTFNSIIKTQAILYWSANNTNWKARYPHFRNKGEWKIGEQIELHYSLATPYKYAIYDKKMWISTYIQCVFYIIFIIIGFLFLI